MVGGSPSFRSVHQQSDDYQAQQAEQRWREAVALDDLGILPLHHLEGKDPPRRNWMVEDTFLKGTVGLVSGDGGIGKSLLMQQLATCAVVGEPWLGKMLTPGRALVMACEDDHDELWRRQDAINRHLNISMWNLLDDQDKPSLQLWARVGQDNSLMYLDRASWKMAPTEMLERIRRRCMRDKIKYLIIDTATQTFRGNQNDEVQVMDYITELRKLAIAMQGIVLVTKHPSMSGRALGTGESGNTAWSNSVRARFYLHKDKSGQLVWEGMKANYAGKGEPLPLRWKDGVYVVDKPEPDYGGRWGS